MSGDAVFPLPEPDFLWVHSLVGLRMNGASATVVDDADGGWHREAANAAPVAFIGYVTAPNPRDVDRAAASGTVLDAVALAPLGTALLQGDWLDCTDEGVPASLRHTFAISLVRPNLSHLRLMLTRSDSPAPYPD